MYTSFVVNSWNIYDDYLIESNFFCSHSILSSSVIVVMGDSVILFDMNIKCGQL